MYLEARNGGSINPKYRKILDTHVASGKISLHTFTTLKSVSWDAATKTFKSIETSAADLSLPPIDHIVFATGIQTDVNTMPCLQNMLNDYPIEVMGGLPCINNDLMWCDDVPLFANGRLAALRLGPGAPNLVGARIGAERIAWNVQDVLEKMKRGNLLTMRKNQTIKLETRTSMHTSLDAGIGISVWSMMRKIR